MYIAMWLCISLICRIVCNSLSVVCSRLWRTCIACCSAQRTSSRRWSPPCPTGGSSNRFSLYFSFTYSFFLHTLLSSFYSLFPFSLLFLWISLTYKNSHLLLCQKDHTQWNSLSLQWFVPFQIKNSLIVGQIEHFIFSTSDPAISVPLSASICLLHLQALRVSYLRVLIISTV